MFGYRLRASAAAGAGVEPATTRFRKPALCPLSYPAENKSRRALADTRSVTGEEDAFGYADSAHWL